MRWLAAGLLLLTSCSKTTSVERAEAAKLDRIFRDAATVDDVLAQIGEHELRSPRRAWGFGYEVTNLRLGAPFYCDISLGAVDGKLAVWRGVCEVTRSRWEVIDKELLQRFPSFYRLESWSLSPGFGFAGRRAELMQARDERRRAALGAMTDVAVTGELRERYEHMLNEHYAANIGEDDCSNDVMYAHLIARAGRWDLLRNALRGPNPSGRAGAAVALLERGELSDEDRRAIRALKDIVVRVCHGSFSQQDDQLRNVLTAASYNFRGTCAALPYPKSGPQLLLRTELEQPDLNWLAMDEAKCASLRAGVRGTGGPSHTPVLTVSLTALTSSADGTHSAAMRGVVRLVEQEQSQHTCMGTGRSEEEAVRKGTSCVVDAAAKALSPSPAK